MRKQCLWTGILNIVKVLIFLPFLHKFYTTPVKIPAEEMVSYKFFKMSLKLIWRYMDYRNLKRKNGGESWSRWVRWRSDAWIRAQAVFQLLQGRSGKTVSAPLVLSCHLFWIEFLAFGFGSVYQRPLQNLWKRHIMKKKHGFQNVFLPK